MVYFASISCKRPFQLSLSDSLRSVMTSLSRLQHSKQTEIQEQHFIDFVQISRLRRKTSFDHKRRLHHTCIDFQYIDVNDLNYSVSPPTHTPLHCGLINIALKTGCFETLKCCFYALFLPHYVISHSQKYVSCLCPLRTFMSRVLTGSMPLAKCRAKSLA